MSKGKYLMGVMVLALLFTGLLVAVPSAQAVTFEFTSNHITDGESGLVPFGNVVLTQNGTSVDLAVNLFNGNLFINTGAGSFQNFLWNATGVTTDDLSGQNLTFIGSSTGGQNGTLHTGGAGDFDFGAVFTGQQVGGAGALAGPLTFSVADAVISDLTIANPDGNLFAADILLGPDQGRSTGKTGMVDVSGKPTQVPEPAVMLLLGLGLISLVGVRRMIKN